MPRCTARLRKARGLKARADARPILRDRPGSEKAHAPPGTIGSALAVHSPQWQVDTSHLRPYLPLMAHRLLLTLLALLTGLAAPVGPASAAASRVAAEQVVPQAEMAAAKAARAPAGLARLPAPGLRNARRHAPARPVPGDAPAVAAVLTGVDRARE